MKEGSSWRPLDWENPIPVKKPIPDKFTYGSAYHKHLLFEAGADAMLKQIAKLCHTILEGKEYEELFAYGGPESCEYGCLWGLLKIIEGAE